MNSIKQNTSNSLNAFNVLNHGLNKNTRVMTSSSALPKKIEQFLDNNYASYNVDQVLVYKDGPEVLRYEIGIGSVYEFTVIFNGDGDFNTVDLNEN